MVPTKPDLDIWVSRVWLWFRAKSTNPESPIVLGPMRMQWTSSSKWSFNFLTFALSICVGGFWLGQWSCDHQFGMSSFRFSFGLWEVMPLEKCVFIFIKPRCYYIFKPNVGKHSIHRDTWGIWEIKGEFATITCNHSMNARDPYRSYRFL